MTKELVCSTKHYQLTIKDNGEELIMITRPGRYVKLSVEEAINVRDYIESFLVRANTNSKQVEKEGQMTMFEKNNPPPNTRSGAW